MAKKKYTDEQRRKRIIELAQRRIGITAPEIMDTFQVDLQTVADPVPLPGVHAVQIRCRDGGHLKLAVHIKG